MLLSSIFKVEISQSAANVHKCHMKPNLPFSTYHPLAQVVIIHPNIGKLLQTLQELDSKGFRCSYYRSEVVECLIQSRFLRNQLPHI